MPGVKMREERFWIGIGRRFSQERSSRRRLQRGGRRQVFGIVLAAAPTGKHAAETPQPLGVSTVEDFVHRLWSAGDGDMGPDARYGRNGHSKLKMIVLKKKNREPQLKLFVREFPVLFPVQ